MRLKPLVAPAPPAPAPVPVDGGPVVVDVTVRPENGMRILTIQLPPYKVVTENERREIEAKRGKRAEAVCDVTGGLIFDPRNVTELKNELRPEFHGRTLSTTFLKDLFGKLAESEKLADKNEEENGRAHGGPAAVRL